MIIYSVTSWISCAFNHLALEYFTLTFLRAEKKVIIIIIILLQTHLKLETKAATKLGNVTGTGQHHDS